MRVTNILRCLGPNIYREAPDGGWGWVVALVFFWVEVCTYGALRILNVYHKDMMPWESTSQMPGIISICVLVFTLSAPLSTVLSNRFGSRPVVMTGGFLISLGSISSAFTSSINEMYITLAVISGLGYCLTFLPTITILAQYFSRRRILVTAFASSGEFLAIFFLAPVFSELTRQYDWRYRLVVLGTIQASVIGCGLLLRPIIIVPEPVKKDNGLQTDALSLKQMQTVYELDNEQTRTSITSGVSGGSEDSGVISLSASNMDLRTAATEAKALMEEQDKEGQGSPPTPEKDQGDLVEAEAGPLQPSIPKLLDFSVLKDGAFICYSLFGLFVTLGFFPLQLIIIELSKTEDMGVLYIFGMISFSFVGEIIGRLFIGVVLNLVCCRKTLVLLGCVVVMFVFSVVAINIELDLSGWLVGYALYGFFMGTVASTHIPLLAEEEVVGIEKMPSCVGVYLFIQSLAGLAGPPVGGVLVAVTQYYSVAAGPAIFYCSAVGLGLSVICLALVGPAKSGLCRRQGRSKEKGNSAEKTTGNI